MHYSKAVVLVLSVLLMAAATAATATNTTVDNGDWTLPEGLFSALLSPQLAKEEFLAYLEARTRMLAAHEEFTRSLRKTQEQIKDVMTQMHESALNMSKHATQMFQDNLSRRHTFVDYELCKAFFENVTSDGFKECMKGPKTPIGLPRSELEDDVDEWGNITATAADELRLIAQVKVDSTNGTLVSHTELWCGQAVPDDRNGNNPACQIKPSISNNNEELPLYPDLCVQHTTLNSATSDHGIIFDEPLPCDEAVDEIDAYLLDVARDAASL